MSDLLNPTKVICARCGDVAKGHATYKGSRFCHGENRPSCYELAQWEGAGV